MKPNHMVYAVLTFGIIVTVVVPRLTTMAFENKPVTYETDKAQELATTNETVASTVELANTASSVDVAIATPVVQEVKVEKPKPEVKKVPEPQKVADPIVFDGLTMTQLSAKLNKSLNSTLAGTGDLFAKYAIASGVDPYLATAITLHETGCEWNCSPAVRNHNNVGGMMSRGSLIHFDSLESGIKSFIGNLKRNYYDQGLNTPELMNKKYASSNEWAEYINSYMNSIKNR